MIAWSDEMRIGLHGQVRRRLVCRGYKLRQRIQIDYVWRYLVLAVDVKEGRFWWKWTHNVKKESTQEVVKAWKEQGVEALVWDRAPSHRSRMVKECGLKLISNPPYSPELNPPERVFQEVRRSVEGIVYKTIENKVEAVEALLNDYVAHPEKIRQLAGYPWILETLSQTIQCSPDSS